MASATFNKGADLFSFVAAQNPALAVKSSAENRSAQTAQGPDSYGDPAAVDMHSETAAPSAEYDIIGTLDESGLKSLGEVVSPTDLEKPVVLLEVEIKTQDGTAPSLSAAGEMVQTGAETLRTYAFPDFDVLPRHRAQDILHVMEFKKKPTSGSGQPTAADDTSDFGLQSGTFKFSLQISKATPKGVLKSFDVRGGIVVATYSLNWYSANDPVIDLTSAAKTAGYVMTSPVSKQHPELGYTEITWGVSKGIKGEEADDDDAE